MHTPLYRLSALFFFSVSLLGTLAVLCYFTSFTFTSDPVVSLDLKKVHRVKNHKYSGNDFALLGFTVDADLTTLFNWNVKQVYTMLTAEYTNKENKINQVTIWDEIIQDKSDAHLKISREATEYDLVDDGDHFRGAEVTLKLRWMVMPITGLFHMGAEGEKIFTMPKKYF